MSRQTRDPRRKPRLSFLAYGWTLTLDFTEHSSDHIDLSYIHIADVTMQHCWRLVTS